MTETLPPRKLPFSTPTRSAIVYLTCTSVNLTVPLRRQDFQRLSVVNVNGCKRLWLSTQTWIAPVRADLCPDRSMDPRQIAAGAWPARFKLKAEVDLARVGRQPRHCAQGDHRVDRRGPADADAWSRNLCGAAYGGTATGRPADHLSEDLISKGIAFETACDRAGIIAQGRIATLLTCHADAKSST